MFGSVIAFDEKRMRGIVRADDLSCDITVEPDDVAGSVFNGGLAVGQRLAFDIVVTMTGPRAERLRRVDGAQR